MRHSTDRLTFLAVSGLLIAVSVVYLVTSALNLYPNAVFYNDCVYFWNYPGDHHGGLRHFSGGGFYGAANNSQSIPIGTQTFTQSLDASYTLTGDTSKLSTPKGYKQWTTQFVVAGVPVDQGQTAFSYLVSNSSNAANISSYQLQITGSSGWPGSVVGPPGSFNYFAATYTVPYFNVVMVCSNQTTTSALCEAKCGNSQGKGWWDPVAEVCTELYSLQEFCAVVQTNMTIFPPNTLVGADQCYYDASTKQTSQFVFSPTPLQNTTTTVDFNVTIMLRDWSDPYLTAMFLTNGTLNFHPNLSATAVPAMGISGAVVLLNFVLIAVILKYW